MDISGWKRDAASVHKVLSEVGDTLVATQECRIYVPELMTQGDLGSIEGDITFVGIFLISDSKNNYGVSRTNALMTLEPSATNVVTMEQQQYIELRFAPGDVVIKNLNLIRTGTLVYRVYDELISKGRVPWYFDDEDLCFLFDTALAHGSANLNSDSAILELIATVMFRDSRDRSKFYRHVRSLGFDPTVIPLNSVALGVSNTTSALMGNFHAVGFTSALVNESTQNESIEDILRA